MASRTSDILPGTLEMLVLQTILEGPKHGYAIAQSIRRMSDEAFAVEQGSLYPALYRLERGDFIKSRWGISDTNRRVKTYRITARGRKQLNRNVAAWEEIVNAVSGVLRRRG